VKREGHKVVFRNYEGKEFTYYEPEELAPKKMTK
jgi:hypothetical protein